MFSDWFSTFLEFNLEGAVVRFRCTEYEAQLMNWGCTKNGLPSGISRTRPMESPTHSDIFHHLLTTESNPNSLDTPSQWSFQWIARSELKIHGDYPAAQCFIATGRFTHPQIQGYTESSAWSSPNQHSLRPHRCPPRTTPQHLLLLRNLKSCWKSSTMYPLVRRFE